MGTLTITNTLAALAAGNQPLSKIDQNFSDIVSIINGNLDVVNVPSLAGKEPVLGNPASDGYLLSSTVGGVRSWIAPLTGQDLNMQVFTGNGTWTKPSGVSKVLVMLWGGGGGGGGGGTGKTGCGGGGGAFGFGVYTVTGNVTVTIGSAGAGGSTSNSGSNGGQSQVSGGGLPSTLTCGGGEGGDHFAGTGGNGGSPGSGWLAKITGGHGGGVAANGAGYAAGHGGDSPMGGPGGGMLHEGATASAVTENVGQEPGGGGSGGPASRSGAAGAKGRAIFIWLA